MRTLRARLILSHVLPILVIVPIIGIILGYFLETQVLLGSFARELQQQGSLIAELTRVQPAVWRDPQEAAAFVDNVDLLVVAHLMLLDPSGRVIASTDPADAVLRGQQLDLPGLQSAQLGQSDVRIYSSRRQGSEVIEVLVPVLGPQGGLSGIVRMTHEVSTLSETLVRLRYVIAAFLGLEILIAAAAGWLLALNLSRPLSRLTQQVLGLRPGEALPPLPERGPEEVRQLVHAFNALSERLHSMDESRSRLLANLVHELGRPLGALLSAVQALLDGGGDDPALRQELLQGMHGEIGRLQRLLDDLTHLHSQTIGLLELNREPTALTEWLPTLLPPWREAARAKGLHWQETIPAGLPVVLLDRDRLAQALGNLLSNALKYTPAGGEVTVSAGHSESEAWVRVSDTGPGIPSEEQERIFEPFYRSQGGRRFPQGLGLGLTIARDLVTAHGGRLEVESTPGLGSHFAIRLPLAANRL